MTDLTQDEFLKREIALWGESYIFDLLDKGFTLTLTTAGWRWLLPSAGMAQTQVSAVDTDPSLCYARGVGVG